MITSQFQQLKITTLEKCNDYGIRNIDDVWKLNNFISKTNQTPDVENILFQFFLRCELKRIEPYIKGKPPITLKKYNDDLYTRVVNNINQFNNPHHAVSYPLRPEKFASCFVQHLNNHLVKAWYFYESPSDLKPDTKGKERIRELHTVYTELKFPPHLVSLENDMLTFLSESRQEAIMIQLHLKRGVYYFRMNEVNVMQPKYQREGPVSSTTLKELKQFLTGLKYVIRDKHLQDMCDFVASIL